MMPEVKRNWKFEIPPTEIRNQILNLLTVGGIAIEGVWSGRADEHFVAWAPLDKPKKPTNGHSHDT
jgi:hypothetical protein